MRPAWIISLPCIIKYSPTRSNMIVSPGFSGGSVLNIPHIPVASAALGSVDIDMQVLQLLS